MESAVLRALCEGVDANDLPTELSRTSTVVMRTLVALQRKLNTDMTGLVTAAHESGLVQVLYGPAA
ncbi:hypothetical protein [Streptomyces sp. NPDC000410]|uniref:hypothetical protein n=1 Tax=Streptomyces sp. NPDC000410 TaxID=3154254 RepID=UPI0033291F1C